MPVAIISGILGQDGSYLAEHLLGLGYNVVGIFRRVSVDNKWRIKNILNNPNLNLVGGDITDLSSISQIIKNYNPKEFYNLAAQSHVGDSFNQPISTFDITGKGVLNCLEAIRLINEKCRFYQASSSEMFGANFSKIKYLGANEEFFEAKYQDENTPFCPQSPYSVAKVAAHYMTGLYRRAYGLYACCGTLFNHEGPRRSEQFVTRKISKYVAQLNKEKFSPLFPKLKLGNINSSRDWGDAEDYVKAMHLMLQQDKPDDFVICTGETHTVREFLDEAFAVVGVGDWGPFVEIDPALIRPAEVDYLRGDYSKAKNVLGWSPKVKFKELVRKMVEADING